MDPDGSGRRTDAEDDAALAPQQRPSEALALWLDHLRGRAGLSFAELAKRSGVSKSTLHEALQGKTPVSYKTFSAVVSTCGRLDEPWEQYWHDMYTRIRAGDQPAPVHDLTPPFWRITKLPANGAAVDSEQTIPTQFAPAGEARPLPEAPHRARWPRLVAAGLALMFLGGSIGGILAWELKPERPDIGTDGEFMEVQWNRNGGPRFEDPATLSRPGEKIPFGRWVRVQCRVYQPSVPSVSPDGFWYLITSPPWNGEYYAAANTFLNGDPEDGPYEHNTDFNVRTCT